ncbi:hypothetical protein [Duganella sp. CF458]|uniref:hypothetical protein n=1 Tax=Duganella sp. CF458 TaxID=1884368 RepID=UPI0011137C7B|nr:hypothetical protein [Duganella sp. CF458]
MNLKDLKVVVFGVLIAMAACSRSSQPMVNPTVVVHLGQPVRQVQENSTYRFPDSFTKPGSVFHVITQPHTFIYSDATLKLQFARNSRYESLGSHIHALSEGTPEPTVYAVTVQAFDDYVDLPTAVAYIRKFRQSLLTQGLAEIPHSTASRFKANFDSTRKADTLDEIEDAFLDSQFFAQRAMALDMTKNNLRLTVTLINGRRLWGDRKDLSDDFMKSAKTRAGSEATKFKRQDLLAERSYSVEISIGDNPNLRK